MKDADEVRTLIKDIWDVRAAKLRKSVNKMINHDGGGGKPLTHVEVLQLQSALFYTGPRANF